MTFLLLMFRTVGATHSSLICDQAALAKESFKTLTPHDSLGHATNFFHRHNPSMEGYVNGVY
jgi:hypothetical protein